jgi:hypothetical protein
MQVHQEQMQAAVEKQVLVSVQPKDQFEVHVNA